MDPGLVWSAGGGIVTVLLSTVGLLWRTITAERKANAALRDQCEKEKLAYVELINQLRKAHHEEMQARIADAQAYADKSLKLQEVVITTVNESKISDSKVAAEIAKNTDATRELTNRLMGRDERDQRGGEYGRPPMKSRP